MADTLILTRTGQIGIEEEATEGTPETLAAGDFALAIKEQSHDFEIGEYEREIMRGTFSKQGVVKGTRLARISGTVECIGGSISTPPVWHRFLVAMSFKRTTATGTAVKSVAVTGVDTGTLILPGDSIANASSSPTKTGTAVYLDRDDNRLYYIPGTGTFAATDTVHNLSNTSSPNPTVNSSPADSGYVFLPFTETASEQPPSFTIERRLGGAQYQLTGARCSGSLMLEAGAPLLLKFEAKGAPVLDGSDRPPVPGQMTGIPAIATPPLPALRMLCRIGTFKPVLPSAELDFGITLTPRRTFTDADYANSGFRGVRVTDRKPVLTVEPENDLTGNLLDASRRIITGSTFPFSMVYGKATHANGLVAVFGRSCQFGGGLNPGDRDGIETYSLTVNFLGDGDNEMTICHIWKP